MSRRLNMSIVAGSTGVIALALMSPQHLTEQGQPRLGAPTIASPTFPTAAPQSGTACLHGESETAAEATRRRQALIATRVINTAQIRQRNVIGRFVDESELLALPEITTLVSGQPSEVAPGWRLRLAATSNEYVFAIKDATDPCGFAYFSDDSGVIYTGQPLQ